MSNLEYVTVMDVRSVQMHIVLANVNYIEVLPGHAFVHFNGGGKIQIMTQYVQTITSRLVR